MQKLPELPEVFFLAEPEFLVEVDPVFFRVVPVPESGYFESARHTIFLLCSFSAFVVDRSETRVLTIQWGLSRA